MDWSGLEEKACSADFEKCRESETERRPGCEQRSDAMMRKGGSGTKELLGGRRRSKSTSAIRKQQHASRPADHNGLPCSSHPETGAAAPSATAVATETHLQQNGEAVHGGAFSSSRSSSLKIGSAQSVLSRSWHGDEDSPRAAATSLLNHFNGQSTRSTVSTRAVSAPQSRTPTPHAGDRTALVKSDRGGEDDDDDDYSNRSLLQQQEQTAASVVGAEKSGGGGGGGGGGGDEDEGKQRLVRRLMVSICVSLVSYITAKISMVPIMSQYVFRRIALENFNLTNASLKQTPCAEGQNSSLQEDLNWVQGQTSQQLLYFNVCTFVPAFFVVLVVGSYADNFGRRFLVVMPMVGGFLESGVVAVVIWMEADLRYVYLANLTDGLLGSIYVLQVGLFAAIADVTVSSRQRVLLFAVLEISLAVAGAVSQVGMGFLIEALGFRVPILVASGLFLAAAVCALLFMPETLSTRHQHAVLNPLVHLKKVFSIYLWDGPPRKRALLVCGQVILFLETMVNLGLMPVETLYEMNSPFCWDSEHIGLVIGSRVLLQNIAGILALKILTKFVRIELIGILGLISGTAGLVLFSLSFSDLFIYISVPAGMLLSTAGPVARTLMSRMVPAQNQGALFASLSAVQALCNLSASALYNTVYKATVDVYPGTVFFLMACTLAIDCALLILFTVMSRNFPHFQELQIEVKAPDTGDVPPPALVPPPRRLIRAGEKTPLLPSAGEP